MNEIVYGQNAERAISYLGKKLRHDDDLANKAFVQDGAVRF